jgi:hypothetical protein
VITNPICGGAYACGKTTVTVRYDGVMAHARSRRKPREEWLALHPGTHEGYVDWERSEAIRRMVSDKHPDEPASRRRQARRCVACRSDQMPSLRAQADAPLHGRKARYPPLQLQPGRCLMPKKTDDDKNSPLQFSLPDGALALLEELVALKEIGSSRAETIRYLVVTGLQAFVDRGRIGKKTR